MEHSIRRYLSRYTTEELEVILAYVLKEENYKDYEHAILEILEILEHRYVLTEVSPRIIHLWERFQRDIAGGK